MSYELDSFDRSVTESFMESRIHARDGVGNMYFVHRHDSINEIQNLRFNTVRRLQNGPIAQVGWCPMTHQQLLLGRNESTEFDACYLQTRTAYVAKTNPYFLTFTNGAAEYNEAAYLANGEYRPTPSTIASDFRTRRFTPVADVWDDLGAVPTFYSSNDIISAISAAHDSGISLMGGLDRNVNEVESDHYFYSAPSQSWSIKTAHPVAVFGGCGWGIGDVYTVGGYLDALGTLKNLNLRKYVHGANSWSDLGTVTPAESTLIIETDSARTPQVPISSASGVPGRYLRFLNRHKPASGAFVTLPQLWPVSTLRKGGSILDAA